MESLMSKLSFLTVLFAAVQILAGTENFETQLDLAGKKYRVIEKNVIGKSYGVFFLVAGATSNRAVAVKNLMEKAQISEGSNRCLMNMNVERRIIFYLLGVVIIDMARADVIEFIEN
jgi:hypothetical protein